MNFTLLEHPLLQDRLSRLRDHRTPPVQFVEHLHQISLLLAMEATRSLPTQTVEVETPLEITSCKQLSRSLVLIPILRAGLGMLSGFHALVPEARVGHLGIIRDEETLEAHVYLEKLPNHLDQGIVFVLDPMLATGHSSATAVARLKNAGAKKIYFICCLAAPEGVEYLAKMHPDVKILSASLDRQLDPRGYILPGLGDAGDRQFGTNIHSGPV